MHPRIAGGLVAVLSFFALASTHAAAPDGIRALTLDNGLRIIVWPDRDIPNVALYNYVRVGSRNEAPGITGLAHFFEHMMFNGTETRPPGEFDREMEARGGSNNASTSDDLTIYMDWFPSSALELVFDLEGDRLAHLAFDPKVIESERGVVYSERRLRVEDDNNGFLAEQVQSTAFAAHPYHFPTIGWPSDIEGWTLADLQAFFRTHYAPNNCTFVVVGDVDADQVFALARKYLAPIPRQVPPPAVRTVEPVQPGEKRVTVERRAQTPLLQLAYKAPKADDPRNAALNLLAVILAQGDASRLHRLLVEERKLAVNVDAYLQEGFDPGLFWLFVTLPAGGDPGEVERVIDAEFARLEADGVTEAELTRARNLLSAAYWGQLATINGKARLLGEYEVMHGDYRKLFELPAAIARVKPADIRAVATELLDARHRTVGVLVPAQSGEEG
ncbi:MAG: zinc protease [Steroidobacteraceae bacterium]